MYKITLRGIAGPEPDIVRATIYAAGAVVVAPVGPNQPYTATLEVSEFPSARKSQRTDLRAAR